MLQYSIVIGNRAAPHEARGRIYHGAKSDKGMRDPSKHSPPLCHKFYSNQPARPPLRISPMTTALGKRSWIMLFMSIMYTTASTSVLKPKYL